MQRSQNTDHVALEAAELGLVVAVLLDPCVQLGKALVGKAQMLRRHVTLLPHGGLVHPQRQHLGASLRRPSGCIGERCVVMPAQVFFKPHDQQGTCHDASLGGPC